MIEYILFIIGLVFLLKGADFLVDGASSLAKKLNVSSLVIGLTVVAFGTSMPELVVNVLAALKGNGDIAFGNIIGSNIANILLILGISSSLIVLKVQHSTVWKEIPYSLLAAIILLIFGGASLITHKTDSISRFEGIKLIIFFIIFIGYTINLALAGRKKLEDEKAEIKDFSLTNSNLMIIFGLVLLYFGGKWVVDGAVAIARLFGLTEYVISLTIIAVGTSLPELVTSIVAAIKKDADIAVGNIVGSNIFNIFWVLGISSAITPISLPNFAIIDLLFLVAVSLLLFVFLFIGKKHELERWQGVFFVLLYISYMAYLIIR